MEDVWWEVRPSPRPNPEGEFPFWQLQEGFPISRSGGAEHVMEQVLLLNSGKGYFLHGPHIPRKHRMVQEGRLISRWDEGDWTDWIPKSSFDRIPFGDIDVIVLSDYGKGSLDEVGEWLSPGKGIVLVDTKRPEKWAHLSPIYFPNLLEWERNEEFYSSPSPQRLVVRKTGPNGADILSGGKLLQHFPATNPHPISTVGAGDVVIAAVAVGMGRGNDLFFSVDAAMELVGMALNEPYTAGLRNANY